MQWRSRLFDGAGAGKLRMKVEDFWSFRYGTGE